MIPFSQSIKSAIRRIATKSGLLHGLALVRPRSAVILRYHSVRSDPAARNDPVYRGIVHAAADFESHIRLLAKKFSPVSIEDVNQYLDGSGTIPKRSVVVTFDDGYLDNYECAAPILRRYGVPAAFYVTVSPMDDGESLWFSRTRHAFEATSARACVLNQLEMEIPSRLG